MSNKTINLNDLITIKDVCIIFGVSEVTIHRWREEKGLNMHTITIPGDTRPAIRYSLKGLLRWAKETETKISGYETWLKEHNKNIT